MPINIHVATRSEFLSKYLSLSFNIAGSQRICISIFLGTKLKVDVTIKMLRIAIQ